MGGGIKTGSGVEMGGIKTDSGIEMGDGIVGWWH
jgi:hypothetical protein